MRSSLIWEATCLALLFMPAAKWSQTNQEKRPVDGCLSYLAEPTPKFSIGREYRIEHGMVLNVSIAPSLLDKDSSLRVVCKLGREHAKEQNLFVHILESASAAKLFNPQGEGNSGKTDRSYRALYSFSRDPGAGYRQSFDWKPDANKPDTWIHIDLGSPPVQ
jgi:hypothetical protein